jgi:hypothetical protein
MENKLPTTERLARALEVANDSRLAQMIERARDGYYDDYKSKLATPITQLIHDLRSLGLEALARRAMDGEFDATLEESGEWFESEGRHLISPEMMQALQLENPNPEGFLK